MWSGAHTALAAALLGVALAPGAPARAADTRSGPVAQTRVREVAEVRIELPGESARPGEQIPIDVLLLDARGAPVDASRVALDCATGSVSPLVRTGEGAHRATLTIPWTLPHPRSAVLSARADGRSAERTLPLVAGAASALEISGPTSVPANEPAHQHLAVAVFDEFGNAADDEPRVSARSGLLPARRVGVGLWSVEYTPGSDPDAREDEVVVEVGAARGQWIIRFTRTSRWLAVAPWMGAVVGNGTGLALGANVSAWWLADPDALGVALDLGWWRLGERSSVALPGGSAELVLERSYLPLTAAFAWTHPLGPRLLATATAGAGAAMVVASQRLTDQPSVDELGWAPAASAGAALGYRLGRGVGFLEARGVWIGDAHLASATGPARALLLVAGYRYDAH